MQPTSDAGLDAELARLETAIRQLKVQYDMFFAGGLPREPVEMRADIERTIRRHSQGSIRKYADRFRLAALVSRFNSLTELWNKTTRSLEEGDRRTTGLVEKFGLREQLLARVRMDTASADPGDLRRLHSRYVDARRRIGEDNVPSYENFVRGLDAQVRRLRERAGCDQIELRLVLRDDKVQLKARPGR